MEYIELENAGRLRIEYDGGPLDLFTIGLLHLNMQSIIDKVSYKLLSLNELLYPSYKRYKRSLYYPISQTPIIRARVNQINSGSFYEEISLLLVAALSDPDIRAVLQNIFANIIWAISASKVKGIISKVRKPVDLFRTKKGDPDIGSNLRDIVLALSEINDRKSANLIIRHEIPEKEKMEVIIEINPKQ